MHMHGLSMHNVVTRVSKVYSNSLIMLVIILHILLTFQIATDVSDIGSICSEPFHCTHWIIGFSCQTNRWNFHGH